MPTDCADHKRFMERALSLAEEAARLGETPVGAIVVVEDGIIGAGFNRVETDHDPTAHAETVALREATRNTGDWRLPAATVYVTLEPCIMCASAFILARVKRVVYGAKDHRWGAVGSLFDFSHDPRLNHELEVIPGVMEEEAAFLMQVFFRRVRDRKRTP